MNPEPIPTPLLESTFKGKIIATKSGNSGQVYIVEHEANVYPRRVAFKSFKLKEELTEKEIGFFMEECELWFTIKNPYIIVPFYAEVIGGQPFVCMPYCEMDLRTLMIEQEPDEVSALVLSCRLIKAVIEMRKSGVSHHQDLNPPNVLVNNLETNFHGHPKDYLINCDLKISDFGIANLRKKVGPTIGGGGGKFPFQAPEQIDRHKYRSYDPDVFALGIMLYMLLTGFHPNGLTNARALNKNTKGSLFTDWTKSNAEITYPVADIENTLKLALMRDPAKRIKPEDILTVFMDNLHYKDDSAYQYLFHRFNYQDHYHRYTFNISRLDNLAGIAKLPGKRKTILKRFLTMLDDQQHQIKSAADVVYYGRTLNYTDSILRKNDMECTDILRHAIRLLQLLAQYQESLTVEVQYPVFDFPGYRNFQPTGIRDYEVSGTYASLAFELVTAVAGENSIIINLEEMNNNFLWSLYYYHVASKLRQSHPIKADEYLKKASKYWPDEPVFMYMSNLWKSML